MSKIEVCDICGKTHGKMQPVIRGTVCDKCYQLLNDRNQLYVCVKDRVGKTYNRLKAFGELGFDVAEIKKYLTKVEALLKEEENPFETVKTQVIGNFDVISKLETTLLFASIDKLTNQMQQANITLIEENEKLKKQIKQLENLKGKDVGYEKEIEILKKEIDTLTEVISTSGDTQLGGTDMDSAIVDYVAEEFKKQSGIDVRNDSMALQRLREASEKAKIELSNVLETDINLPFITADASGPKHLVMKLTRAKLKELVRPIVENEKLQKTKEKTEKKAKQDNSIGMKFTMIPAGEFYMGSEERDSEKPLHEVKIKNPFYLGTYPVTQREWKSVMGDNKNPFYFKGDDLPVENVSWDEMQDFIKKLNEKEGTDKYRLPSEAEWEYACRAGTTTRYSFGNSESKLGAYAWYRAKPIRKTTHPVGQKDPNSWGLYDMHGNVWEWVQDEWHENYDEAPTDGSAWKTGEGVDRVVRGGSWYGSAGSCRSAFRGHRHPRRSGSFLGFRILQEQ